MRIMLMLWKIMSGPGMHLAPYQIQDGKRPYVFLVLAEYIMVWAGLRKRWRLFKQRGHHYPPWTIQKMMRRSVPCGKALL